jgi:hypothetical protein
MARLETLAHLNRVVASSLKLSDTLNEVAQAAATLMGATFASFSLADERTRTLEVVAFSDPVIGSELPFQRRRFDEGVVGWVATRRQPLEVPDVFADPRVSAPEFCRRHHLTSFYGVPIILDEVLLGVLALTGRAPFRFSAEDLELLESVTAQGAVAIRNARLYKELERRLHETETLLGIAQSLATSVDPAEVARRTAREVTRLLGADTSICFEVDTETGEGVPVAAYHVPPALLDPAFRIALDNVPSFFRGAREVIASANVAEDPRLDHPVIRDAAMVPRSLLYAPVVRDGRTTGALITYWWHQPHWVTAEEIRLVSGIAHQLMFALENAHLHKETERRRREAQVVADVARSISAALDLPAILRVVADGAKELCQTEIARIALRDPASGDMVMRHGLHRDAGEAVRIAAGQGSGGWVMQTGRPFRTANYLADPRITSDFRAIAEREGLGAHLVVPIRMGDVIEGLLYVGRRTTRPFTERDEAVLLTLAGHAAIAIRNTQHFEREQAARALAESSEEALRETADRLRAVVDSTTDAIIVTDDTGKIVSWNKGAEAMFGYTESEIFGQPLYLLMPERYRRAHRAGLARFMETGQGRVIGRTVELDGVRRDGTEFPVELSLATWQRPGGRFVSGILRDLTARKQAEQALRESEQKLQQAQKMEAVGRLAGGVAHDFNNLLTVITGRSELVRMRVTGGREFQKDMDIVHQTATRAAALTRQLLAFSRRQVMLPVVLDVSAIIAGMTQMLRRLIGEDIELAVVTADDCHVKTDPSQMEQVVMNLVVNACDAMPNGGRLVIETTRMTTGATNVPALGPGEYVVLAVTDTGSGMTAETKARIFEPFFTTKGPERGSGLGLATVYGIVKQSGGEIAVESEPGRGTTFRVYLPWTHGQPESEPATGGGTAVKGRETILLVEDEPEVRLLVQELLEEAGYHVLVADGPGEALLIGERAGHIDLILTDVVMPQMRGYDLVARLLEVRPDLAVLYMSGYAEERREPATGGAAAVPSRTAFLEKPFSLTSLAAKVRETLDRRAPR